VCGTAIWQSVRDACAAAAGEDRDLRDSRAAGRVLSVLMPTSAVYVGVIWRSACTSRRRCSSRYFMIATASTLALQERAWSIGVPLLFFVMFERWFLVPLPKGPIEPAAGASERHRKISGIQLSACTASPSALTPPTSGSCFVGIVLGVLIGVLPGLGGANGVAILLPLTFTMSPTSAIIMLSCIYWGALFGGAITSILFNIPGEPWSVATTFDGYPLAQQGSAGEALTAAFTSSFIGALVAVLMITFLGAAGREVRAQVRPGGILRGAVAHLLQLRRHEQGAIRLQDLAAMMLGFALAPWAWTRSPASCA
jgi:hypothetical protein